TATPRRIKRRCLVMACLLPSPSCRHRPSSPARGGAVNDKPRGTARRQRRGALRRERPVRACSLPRQSLPRRPAAVTTTNLSASIRSREAELQRRGVEFSLCDLIAWATAAWPLAWEEPDARRWADAFLESRPAPRPSLAPLPGSAGAEDVLALYRH